MKNGQPRDQQPLVVCNPREINKELNEPRDTGNIESTRLKTKTNKIKDTIRKTKKMSKTEHTKTNMSQRGNYSDQKIDKEIGLFNDFTRLVVSDLNFHTK